MQTMRTKMHVICQCGDDTIQLESTSSEDVFCGTRDPWGTILLGTVWDGVPVVLKCRSLLNRYINRYGLNRSNPIFAHTERQASCVSLVASSIPVVFVSGNYWDICISHQILAMSSKKSFFPTV
jgi:hypothetical protein